MPLNPSTRSWEISREQVNIIKNIGKGAFAQVAEATVQNINDNEQATTLAVKMLKGYGYLFFLLRSPFSFPTLSNIDVNRPIDR